MDNLFPMLYFPFLIQVIFSIIKTVDFFFFFLMESQPSCDGIYMDYYQRFFFRSSTAELKPVLPTSAFLCVLYNILSLSYVLQHFLNTGVSVPYYQI